MDAALARLNNLNTAPFDAVQAIALVIRTTRSGQQHIGIVYKDPDDPQADTTLIDLQWHYALSSRPILPKDKDKYLWVTPSIDPETAYVLARLCNKVGTKYSLPGNVIGYALRYYGVGFDVRTGELGNKKGLGLTCATFVLAIFASYGIPLLELATWRKRAEDKLWGEQIVADLRKHGADEKHVEAVNKQVKRGCLRYRPEEVAAAGAAPSVPIGFEYAEELGKRIVKKLGDAR